MTNTNLDDIGSIDAEIRLQLERGVSFGQRVLAVKLTPDVSWVKVDVGTRQVTAIYMKGAVKVTVNAVLQDGGKVEIVSASLDKICGRDAQ
jgi:hypothetical protein